MPRCELEIPGTPVSLNQLGSRSSYYAYARAKRDLERDLGIVLMAAGKAFPRRRARHVSARAVLTFTTSRRRDEGNFRWLIEKALGDVLVAGGWLPDDTAEHYSFERVLFEQGSPATTRIELEWNA